LLTSLLSVLVVSVVFRAVRQTLSGRECLYVDGGILDQYPIYWFDGKLPLNYIHNCFVICLRLVNWLFSIFNTD